jgi:membrane associated rhomboid family serine protease
MNRNTMSVVFGAVFAAIAAAMLTMRSGVLIGGAGGAVIGVIGALVVRMGMGSRGES